MDGSVALVTSLLGRARLGLGLYRARLGLGIELELGLRVEIGAHILNDVMSGPRLQQNLPRGSNIMLNMQLRPHHAQLFICMYCY